MKSVPIKKGDETMDPVKDVEVPSSIGGLSVRELNDLVKELQEQWGIAASIAIDSFRLEQIRELIDVLSFIRDTKATLRLDESQGLAETFSALVTQWEEDTGHISSSIRKYEHPSYRNIISLGEQVIPLILQEMQKMPRHWFYALREITHGENPAVNATKVEEAKLAWMEWGKQRGYIGG